MSRGIGVVEFTSQLPEVVVAIAGLVTQFGDMWFVMLVVGGLLAAGYRRRRPAAGPDPLRAGCYLFALAVGAYAFTLILKHTFALPRPAGAATATAPAWLPALADGLYASMVTGDGYGFPSGHALKSTAFYGGAALVLDVWDRRRRLLVGGGLAALVGLSRVFLGVHYLVDVVVGVALGVGFLWGMQRATGTDPRRALLVAGALGVVGLAVAGTLKAGLAGVAPLVVLGLWEYRGRSRTPRAEPL